jgi:hypothetical protein
MKNFGRIASILIFIASLSIAGCAFQSSKSIGYPEVPSMLNILTNKAQIAVEEGYFDKGGETAVLEYVNNKSPNTLTWFSDQGLDLRVGVVSATAIVMVCDQGAPVYEDTYCRPGAPDKDHRNSSIQECEIIMTEAEVLKACE